MKRAAVLLLAAGLSGAMAFVSTLPVFGVWVMERFVWLAVPGRLVGMLVHSGNAALTLIVTWLFYFGLFYAIGLWREQRSEQGVEAR